MFQVLCQKMLPSWIFLRLTNDVAVTASPLDWKIVADIMASVAAKEPPPEDDRPLPTLHGDLSAADVRRRYCSGIQRSGLEFI